MHLTSALPRCPPPPAPLFHCISTPLSHCSPVSMPHCLTVLHYCFIASVPHCMTDPLPTARFTVLPLTASLLHCTTPLLSRCSTTSLLSLLLPHCRLPYCTNAPLYHYPTLPETDCITGGLLLCFWPDASLPNFLLVFSRNETKFS
jgi:hypothetical protein